MGRYARRKTNGVIASADSISRCVRLLALGSIFVCRFVTCTGSALPLVILPAETVEVDRLVIWCRRRAWSPDRVDGGLIVLCSPSRYGHAKSQRASAAHLLSWNPSLIAGVPGEGKRPVEYGNRMDVKSVTTIAIGCRKTAVLQPPMLMGTLPVRARTDFGKDGRFRPRMTAKVLGVAKDLRNCHLPKTRIVAFT